MAEAADPGPYTAEERAILAFFSIEGIGPVTLDKLRDRFGRLAEALAAPADQVADCLRDDATRARFHQIEDLGSLADRLFEKASAVGAHVLFPGRPEWPRQLTSHFPPVLYVRGTIEPQAARVAIVGSRESDEYGRQVAAFFAGALAERRVGIVSGGALGVDGAAHKACLGLGGQTVAVLGCGVDVVYPPENRLLFQEMVRSGGALVSHFPPGTPGVPQNFKVRNRVIAALSDAVVVARASAGSGALGTAMAAIELERPVFAVPGDVTNPLAAGVNGLLEDAQARACTGLAPIAQAIGLEGGDWPSATPIAPAPTRAKRPTARSVAPPPRLARRSDGAEVPGELRPVWLALGREPLQFDELLKRCKLDAAGLSQALVRLELLGLCEERLGKVFVRT